MQNKFKSDAALRDASNTPSNAEDNSQGDMFSRKL